MQQDLSTDTNIGFKTFMVTTHIPTHIYIHSHKHNVFICVDECIYGCGCISVSLSTFNIIYAGDGKRQRCL